MSGVAMYFLDPSLPRTDPVRKVKSYDSCMHKKLLSMLLVLGGRFVRGRALDRSASRILIANQKPRAQKEEDCVILLQKARDDESVRDRPADRRRILW